MIALISQFPKYCSSCGRCLRGHSSEDSFICLCGAGYQKASADIILEVSEELGGDLHFMELSEEDGYGRSVDYE